jgi:hypothetical protein
MREIYLPDLGQCTIQKILIFSNNKALLLGEQEIYGIEGISSIWTYFDPETGETIGY